MVQTVYDPSPMAKMPMMGMVNTCLLYLFPGWTVDSKGGYAAAILGTFAIPILLSLIDAARSLLVLYVEGRVPKPSSKPSSKMSPTPSSQQDNNLYTYDDDAFTSSGASSAASSDASCAASPAVSSSSASTTMSEEQEAKESSYMSSSPTPSPAWHWGTLLGFDMTTSILFGLQMFLAYVLMLLVMLYEAWILFAIVAGFIPGVMLSSMIKRKYSSSLCGCPTGEQESLLTSDEHSSYSYGTATTSYS